MRKVRRFIVSLTIMFSVFCFTGFVVAVGQVDYFTAFKSGDFRTALELAESEAMDGDLMAASFTAQIYAGDVMITAEMEAWLDSAEKVPDETVEWIQLLRSIPDSMQDLVKSFAWHYITATIAEESLRLDPYNWPMVPLRDIPEYVSAAMSPEEIQKAKSLAVEIAEQIGPTWSELVINSQK